jgi:omega-hydroxy-beta-dihydromenaquinone-9 sulfotransferase
MDPMPMAFDRPQENEFALCNLGQPSPYFTIAFPNHPQWQAFFDLEQLTPEQVGAWKHCFLAFLKQITVRRPKRIVLKSPTHTYRIKLLLDLFPKAKFVHLVRDPYVLFPSTVHLWKSLYRTQGLQSPRYKGLEEYVFKNFTQMYERLDEVRPLLNTTNFHELRYEDLVTDPIAALRDIYEQLGLGDFARLVPKVQAYLEDFANYKVNEYELTVELRETITRRWGHVIRRYGYACDETSD